MEKKELAKVIREHKEWVLGSGGQRADLRGSDLRGSDLRGSDLRGSDLRYCNLRGSDLSGSDLRGSDLRYCNLSYCNLRGSDLLYCNLLYCNLRGSDLRGSNLSGSDLRYCNLKDTVLENINWLAYIGIVPNKSGYAYAYKIITAKGEGIYNGGINYDKGKAFSVDKVDTDVYEQCSYGINLATFAWCLNAFTEKTYRLFMFKFNVKDAVCPIGSDGKFRVKKCTKVGECNWQGNSDTY